MIRRRYGRKEDRKWSNKTNITNSHLLFSYLPAPITSRTLYHCRLFLSSAQPGDIRPLWLQLSGSRDASAFEFWGKVGKGLLAVGVAVAVVVGVGVGVGVGVAVAVAITTVVAIVVAIYAGAGIVLRC